MGLSKPLEKRSGEVGIRGGRDVKKNGGFVSSQFRTRIGACDKSLTAGNRGVHKNCRDGGEEIG